MEESRELELRQETKDVAELADGIVVKNDNDFAFAADLTKRVKAYEKKVKDFWEPLRKSTYEAYSSILAKTKEMTEPLSAVEKVLKKKMSDYVDEKERQKRIIEEEARKAALAEMKKKEEEAQRLEEEGDVFGAAEIMMEVDAMNSAVQSISVSDNVKVEGVSQRKSWEITGIDASKVPVEVSGVCVRPVDESAVLALIKSTHGQVQIPGVTFKEVTVMAVRS